MITYKEFDNVFVAGKERKDIIIDALKEKPMTINELKTKLPCSKYEHIQSSLIALMKANIVSKKRFGVYTYYGLRPANRT